MVFIGALILPSAGLACLSSFASNEETSVWYCWWWRRNPAFDGRTVRSQDGFPDLTPTRWQQWARAGCSIVESVIR